MDVPKLRVIAGGAAILFGVAGTVAISISVALALSLVVGLIWSTLIVALLYFAAAFAGLYIFLMPHKETTEEIADIEAATADALSDLPIEAVRQLVEKQPLSALAVALAAGYAVSNDPKGVAKNAQRLVFGLL